MPIIDTLRIAFCGHCGIRTLIINGDRSLFLEHGRRNHPTSRRPR